MRTPKEATRSFKLIVPQQVGAEVIIPTGALPISSVRAIPLLRLERCSPSILLEGGIFWCYGLFTFARFLGSHSDLGWAWNRAPNGDNVSAEFVESFLIFFYGITNTWMERFGAHPGDPYTAKQIQHIGIAVRHPPSLATGTVTHREQ